MPETTLKSHRQSSPRSETAAPYLFWSGSAGSLYKYFLRRIFLWSGSKGEITLSNTLTHQDSLRNLILNSIFTALIIVMTVVPYTGYISYGGVIEVTTLHIITALGAVCLGWKSGAVTGAVWGLTSLLRAYIVYPVYLAYGFGNVFVAVVPRIIVGIVAGGLFSLLRKTKLDTFISSAVSAAAATLTNTVLVLSSMNIWLKFYGKEYSSFFDTVKSIFSTIIAVNGLIELTAAVIIVPVVYKAISKSLESHTT